MSEHDTANNAKPPLRRLLPATAPRSVQILPAETTVSERQTSIPEACSACRKQKTK
ncbi:hypothetical protein E4U21_001847, partial [Claviceps maximensis]